MKQLRGAVLVVAACLFPLAAAAELPSLSAFEHLTSIREPALSHDGRFVAFIARTGDYAKDRWNSKLLVIGTDGGATRMLSTAKGLGDPQWSFDNKTVYFTANDKKDTAQVFAVPIGGGVARQITHSPTDVEQYSIDPKHARLVFVRENEPSKDESQRHNDLWEVHNDGLTTRYRPQPSHLWLATLDGRSEKRLTDGTWSVLESIPPFVGASSDPSWASDGSRIVFTMQGDADDSDTDKTRVAIVDATTGIVTMGDTQHHDYEYQPMFGTGDMDRSIAFIYPHGPGPISVMDLHVLSGQAGPVDVTSQADLDIDSFAFLPHGVMVFHAPTGVQSQLYIFDHGKISPLAQHGLQVGAYAAGDNGAVAFSANGASCVSELYVTDPSRTHVRQLTHLNELARIDWGKREEFRWTTRDGKQADGVLTYPPGFAAGKTYPLVLRIHGGPESSTTLRFGEYTPQLLAAHGYVVLEPNYRGSDNLGTAYEHAIFQDAGTGPGNDVLDGVKALEAKGFIDTAREAVTGHSYGGFMTTWLISHDTRWRAAVVGDGMVDWIQEYNLSGTGNLAWARDSFGGSPWDPTYAQMYRDQSPITFVSAIKTPTRLISGTSDAQVPFTESYELYHALHDQGVPVSFVAIPGALHFPSDPVRIEGYYRVTLEWIDRYMH